MDWSEVEIGRHLTVAKYFWYICLLGRAIAGHSYRWFIAISYKFKLPLYIRTVGDR